MGGDESILGRGGSKSRDPKEGKHRVCVCLCVYELCGWHSKQDGGSGTRDEGGGRQGWIREAVCSLLRSCILLY